MRRIFCFVSLFVLCALLAPPAVASELRLIRPIRGPILAYFDESVTRYGPGHRGIDIAASIGDSVVAAADGVVSFAGQVAGRPSVSVRHSDGRRTTYTPVAAAVSVGQFVSADDLIGTVSGPTHCEQSCLHWGLTDGIDYWDPLALTAEHSSLRLLPEGTRPPPPPVVAPGGTAGAGSYPVDGPITSRYGMRVHPITGEYKLHDGTDFGVPCGTSIRAWNAGTVVSAQWDNAYGYRVIIAHGAVRTGYAHLPGLEVTVGQHVTSGQQIGTVGSTGYSTGCHLHWMAWQNGSLVDPLTLA